MTAQHHKIIKFIFILLIANVVNANMQLFSTTLQSKSTTALQIKAIPGNSYPIMIKGTFSYSLSMSKLDIAKEFLTDVHKIQATLNSLANETNFTYIKQISDTLKQEDIVHLRQSYKGITVFPSDIAIHINQLNQVKMMNGQLDKINIDIHPSFNNKEALAIALQAITANNTQLIKNEIEIFTYNNYHYLSYHLVIRDELNHAEWHILIDAHNGKIIKKYNNIKSDLYRRIYSSLNSDGSSYNLTLKEGEHSADSVIQTNYDILGTVYRYFKDTHNLDSYNNHGISIDSVVKIPNYNNAYYDGFNHKFGFGNGDGVIFSYLGSDLDIVAHEYGHGITDYSCGLEYYDQYGALNEAISDMWSIMLDTEDWLIGEQAYTPSIPGDALRYLNDPPQGDQPDSMLDYENISDDNGGIHTNSGIINKATYFMCTALDRNTVSKIYVRALVNYFTENTDFQAARNYLIQSAGDLYGNTTAQKISDSFDKVAIFDTTMPTDDFTEIVITSPYSSIHPYPNNYVSRITINYTNALQIAVRFATLNTESGYDFVKLYDSNNSLKYSYSGFKTNFISDYVIGNTVYVELRSDSSITDYGYDMAGYICLMQKNQVALLFPNNTILGEISSITGNIAVPSLNNFIVEIKNMNIPSINFTLTPNPMINGLFSVTWNTYDYSNGPYLITLRAYDIQNQQYISTRSVIVYNKTTIYIQETGQAFYNIQDALNNAQDNQHIILNKAIYTGTGNYNLIWPSVNNLTLMGKPTINTVSSIVLDGTSYISDSFFIKATRNVNFTLANITFTNGYSTGTGLIIISNNRTSHITINNCFFYDNDSAAIANGALININQNRDSSMIFLNINNSTFCYNGVFNGSLFNGGNIIAINNIFYENYFYLGSLFTNCSATLINTLMYKNMLSDLKAYFDHGYNYKLYNSTCLNNSGALTNKNDSFSLLNCLVSGNVVSDVNSTDNIIITNTAFGFGKFPTKATHHGVIYDFNALNFVNYSANDFRLNTMITNPAIDGGDMAFMTELNSAGITVTHDINNNNRISGKSIDLGAYESDSELSAVVQDIINPLSAPNPFNPLSETAHIGFTLVKNVLVKIYIIALNGDLLFESNKNCNSGYNEFTWDGRDKLGQIVKNGGYYAYLIIDDNGNKIKKLIKIAILKK